VGLKRAHAEFLGQSEGMPVVGFGQGNIWEIVVQRGRPEEPQSPRLVTAFLAITGEHEGTLGELARVLCTAN
jgi:hypothetical protein